MNKGKVPAVLRKNAFPERYEEPETVPEKETGSHAPEETDPPIAEAEDIPVLPEDELPALHRSLPRITYPEKDPNLRRRRRRERINAIAERLFSRADGQTAGKKKNGGRAGGSHRAAAREDIVRTAGWIFLAVVVVAVLAAGFLLLRAWKESTANRTDPVVESTVEQPGQTAAHPEFPEDTAGSSGGQPVNIKGLDCSFETPESLVFGTIQSVDFSDIGETVAANVRLAGWGNIGYSLSGDGSLILYAKDAPFLREDAYEMQEAFLAGTQPEQLARTFLQDSNIISLLKKYGLTMTTEVENDGGVITFRGRGEQAQTSCSVQFAFLYTGAFRQARLQGTYLADPVETRKVISLSQAAVRALSWNSSGRESVRVQSAEIRSIRGLPFYVMLCSDGTSAYALAIETSELELCPEAKAVYESILAEGLQEYIETAGAE